MSTSAERMRMRLLERQERSSKGAWAKMTKLTALIILSKTAFTLIKLDARITCRTYRREEWC